jgi:putative PEP-CTERM system TPR-repeat lipoprotein
MPNPLKPVLLLFLVILLAACGGAESRTPEEYIAAAQEYLDKDELRPALIELKNALMQAPDNAHARRLLGELYLTLGDGASAEKELERAASLGVDPGFIQPLLARALLTQQDYNGVLEINPHQEQLLPAGKASIHASRGMALLALEKPDEADREFELGLGQDAESPEVLTGQAWLAASRQQPDQARELLDRVFTINADYAEAWSLLGNIERSQGNLETALEAYSKAADNRHANTLDILYRISLNISLENYDQARTEIAAQRKQGTGNYLLDYLEGLLYYQEKRYTDARPLFERALQADPRHVLSLLYAGVCNLQEGNLEQTRGYLLSLDSINPGYGPALKMLAWIAIQNGQYVDAERFIRQVLAKEPDDVFSLNLLSSALIGDKKNVEGLEVLQQVVALQPDSADARMKLGVGMILEGKLESGLKELEASRELDSGVLQTSLAIIFTYLRNNEPDKALDAALNLRDSHPDSVVAKAALGTVYLTRQENDKAVQAFRDTLALDSNNVTALSGLASLAVQAGQPEEAKAYYRKILETHPGSLNTSMNLAYLSALDGSVDEMKAVLEQAIETNPRALLPRMALARHYTEQGDYAKVIDILAPVRESASGNFTYLKMLSEAQYRSGDNVDARNNLEALVEVAPNNASAHYLLAVTYRKLGNVEGFRDQLAQVLALEPSHIGALTMSIELMITDGNAQAARENIDVLRKQSGNTVDVLLLEGRLASSTGDHKAAVAAYRSAFEMNETNINLLKLEAATWDAGDRDAAVDLLTSWLDKLPADQASSARLASRYVAMGKESEAITVYSGMLKQTPDNVAVLNNLAWLLQDSDPKQALEYAEKAHSLAPDSHTVTDTLAVMVSKSDPHRAQLLIREALNASPGNPGFRYHQALIYKRADEPEQALRVVKQLLEDTSSFPEAGDARQLLKELGG